MSRGNCIAWISVGLLAMAFVPVAAAQSRRVDGRRPERIRATYEAVDRDERPSLEGAYAPRLLPGSKAPALPTLITLHGPEVKDISSGIVTVVEFWASWCPNCRDRVRRLGEMEQRSPNKVRELAIVCPDRYGSSERGAREMSGQAAESQGTIAFDAEGSCRAEWITPARRDAVPVAFVVNGEGVIAWIGHPTDEGDVIERVLAGTWDIDDSLARYAARFQETAWRDDASRRITQAAHFSNDWDALLRALDDLDLYQPSDAGQRAVGLIRDLLGKNRATALRLAGIAERVLWDQNPLSLNSLSWGFLNVTEPTDEEIALARRLAERASDHSSRENAMIEDTLALAQYRDGDREEAILTQERAVRLCTDSPTPNGQILPELKNRLQLYRENAKVGANQHKRWREPVNEK